MRGMTAQTTSALAVNKRDPAYAATLPPTDGRKRKTLRGCRKTPTTWEAALTCGCHGPYDVCEESMSHDTAMRLGLMEEPTTAAERERKAGEELARLRAELAAASWRK